VRMRLSQDIAQRRAERAGEDEGRPEQERMRHPDAKIRSGDDCQRSSERECTAFVAEPRAVRDEIAESGTEGVGEENCEPIKRFSTAGGDVIDRNAAGYKAP
jgi:hypothetical protein